MSLNNKDGHVTLEDIRLNYSVSGNVTGFVAGTGTTAVSGSKWAGASGASAYTVGDIVTALKNLGMLAA